MTKIKTKNEQGITFVALIITIIILIILAAVSIVHMLNLQIIGQAVNGTQDYSAAQYDEKNEMVNIANMLESTIAGVKNNQGGTTTPGTPEGPGDSETPEGSNPWNNDKLKGVKVKDKTGNDVSVPVLKDAEVLNPGATIDEGIVIKDENENEWVWVPVDSAKYNSMFKVSETPIVLSGSTGVTTTKYSKGYIVSGIPRGLPGSTDYREPDLVTDYDNDARAQEAGFSNLNDMAASLVQDYETMAESVRKYGGFYIGRYELTDNGSKPGAPLVGRNWYSLYAKCKSLAVANSGGITRMIWGCQWEITCKWIEEVNGESKSITNSSSWGNYKDVEVYNSEGTEVIKESGTATLLNTGITTYTRANNIYDLAGNAFEWTHEAGDTNRRVLRGAHYGNNCSGYSVTYRGFNAPTKEYNHTRLSSYFDLESVIPGRDSVDINRDN